jgi:mycoredoxin
MMLERGLNRAGLPVRKHNIWESEEAATEVRRWANGNETVPTVVIGDVGLVNPSATDVFVVLADRAPHLLPPEWDPPKPGRIAEAARRILGG